MKIGSRQLGHHESPYMIAEIGVNHDGKRDLALRLVSEAKACGADAIKLQMFDADLLMSSACALAKYQENQSETDAKAMLARLQLDDDSIEAVCHRARELGLHAIVTVFSIELVGRAAQLPVDAFKVASPDLINRPLLDALGSTKRPLIVSTGAASLEEVGRTASWLAHADVAFLQCISAYPTPVELASIGALREIERLTNRVIGYSDHTTETITGAVAVGAGACILEKHLTYDTAARGPDHAASLNPASFAEYVRFAKIAHSMLGADHKRVLPIEEDVRRVSRQSVTALNTIERGQRITRDLITIKRPGEAIEPFRLDEVLGSTATRRIAANQPIQWKDLT